MVVFFKLAIVKSEIEMFNLMTLISGWNIKTKWFSFNIKYVYLKSIEIKNLDQKTIF